MYISLACPWACASWTILKLKGLEDAISVSMVAPVWDKINEEGRKSWVFKSNETIPDFIKCGDPINNFENLR